MISINESDFSLLKMNIERAYECSKGFTPISYAEKYIFNRLRYHLQTAGAILGRQVLPEIGGDHVK